MVIHIHYKGKSKKKQHYFQRNPIQFPVNNLYRFMKTM